MCGAQVRLLALTQVVSTRQQSENGTSAHDMTVKDALSLNAGQATWHMQQCQRMLLAARKHAPLEREATCKSTVDLCLAAFHVILLRSLMKIQE